MAAQYGLDVIYVVVDNAGWQSIRDLQLDAYGEEHGFAAEFRTPAGAPITPDLVAVARGFGVQAGGGDRRAGSSSAALGRALRRGRPDRHRRARPTRVPRVGRARERLVGRTRAGLAAGAAGQPTRGRWQRSDTTP